MAFHEDVNRLTVEDLAGEGVTAVEHTCTMTTPKTSDIDDLFCILHSETKRTISATPVAQTGQ